MSNAVRDRLQEVFRTVLELPTGSDVRSISQESEPGWDSVAHVWLVSGIESEFNVSIDTGDSLRITSFESAERLLREMGVA